MTIERMKELEEMERIEEMFAELQKREGFEYWWQSEERWEDWEKEMIKNGFNEKMVSEFFKEAGEEI